MTKCWRFAVDKLYNWLIKHFIPYFRYSRYISMQLCSQFYQDVSPNILPTCLYDTLWNRLCITYWRFVLLYVHCPPTFFVLEVFKLFSKFLKCKRKQLNFLNMHFFSSKSWHTRSHLSIFSFCVNEIKSENMIFTLAILLAVPLLSMLWGWNLSKFVKIINKQL